MAGTGAGGAGGIAGAAGQAGSGVAGQGGSTGSAGRGGQAGGAPVGGSGGAAGGRGGAGAGGVSGGGVSGGGGRGGQAGGAGAAGRGGQTGAAGSGGASGCMNGHITYTLQRSANPTAAEQQAYDRITAAMDTALTHYNCYTNITKALSVSYVPSVATADGSTNGSIRFGSTASMNFVTAMHETSHTLGVGAPAYDALIMNGIFTGVAATAQLREIDGDPAAQVHGDTNHFWPYGLNYETEYRSITDAINHCKMVVAIRRDIGSI